MGNPSRAGPDPSQKHNFLMNKECFAHSYSNSTGTPNGVPWHLMAQDFGDAPHRRQFDPDDTLPSGVTKIAHRDDAESGFDRGHLCPHSDRDKTSAMSVADLPVSGLHSPGDARPRMGLALAPCGLSALRYFVSLFQILVPSIARR
jgi:endonuclease G